MMCTVFSIILLLHQFVVSNQVKSRFECGENGKFEYCIDGFTACVIGCHCYPGFYFDVNTKICEPNSKLFEQSRRYNELLPIEIPTVRAVHTKEPEISTLTAITDSVTTEPVTITSTTENLGDWLYNQFFKTIENSVFNGTDEKLQTRRSNGDSLKDNLIRVKKKAKKSSRKHNKRANIRKKSLRMTENDSIFDSGDDTSSSDDYIDDSTDTSDSGETSCDSESASNDNSRGHDKMHGNHKHKQLLIINKKPKVPLPSFLFLPNMGAQYYPQMPAPPPVPMYPLVPVPPVMPSMYSYPECSEEQHPQISTTTEATKTTTEATKTTTEVTTQITTSKPKSTTKQPKVTTLPPTTTKAPETTSKEPQTTVLSSDDSDSDNSKETTTASEVTTAAETEEATETPTTTAANDEVTEANTDKPADRQGRINSNKLKPNFKRLVKKPMKTRPKNIKRIPFKSMQPSPLKIPIKIKPQIQPIKTTPTKFEEPLFSGLEDSLADFQFEKPPIEIDSKPPNFKYLSDLIHKDFNKKDNVIPPIIANAVQPKTIEFPQNKQKTNMNIPYKLLSRRNRPETNNNNDIINNHYYSDLGKEIAQLVRRFNSNSENNNKDVYQGYTYNFDPLHQQFSEKLNSQPSRSYWERSVRSLNKLTPFPLSKSRRTSDNILLNLEDRVNQAAKSIEMLGLEELENIINIMGRIQSNSNNEYTHAKISQSSFDVGLEPVMNHKTNILKLEYANPQFQQETNLHTNIQSMNPQLQYMNLPVQKIQHDMVQINQKTNAAPQKTYSYVKQMQTNMPVLTQNVYASNKSPLSRPLQTHLKPVLQNNENLVSFLTANVPDQRAIPIPIGNLAKFHFNSSKTEHNLFIPNYNSNNFNINNKNVANNLQRNNLISPYNRMPFFNKYYITTKRPLGVMYSGLVPQIPLLKYRYPSNNGISMNRYNQQTQQRLLGQPVHQQVQSPNLFLSQGSLQSPVQGKIQRQRENQPRARFEHNKNSFINSINRVVNNHAQIAQQHQPSYFHHNLHHFDFFD